jgi:outer membrane protein OmpA-like peptidoglycan-associated protein
MMKTGIGLCAAALALASITGCTTKNYVKSQTAPLVDHTNQLDEKTAANNRSLHDVDDRAQAGIKTAQGAADSANQNAQSAAKSAGDAETAANDAVHRADSLDSVIKGLDSYKPLGNVSVTFGFDKAVLTKDSKEQLDGFAQKLTSTSSYILAVTGGTDSIGSAEYNYGLSQRRADAVVQYLVLSDRDWQGQRSGSEHNRGRAQAESPGRDSAAVEFDGERRTAGYAGGRKISFG